MIIYLFIVHVSPPHYAILTHWPREPHIGVSVFVIIGPRNGLAPGRPQTISWTNDDFPQRRIQGTILGDILYQ